MASGSKQTEVLTVVFLSALFGLIILILKGLKLVGSWIYNEFKQINK